MFVLTSAPGTPSSHPSHENEVSHADDASPSRAVDRPGEDEIPVRVSQYLLQVPSQQDLELLSQPAIKRTLGGRQFLQGLVRLLC